LHEIKFDGYRLQARVEAGRVKLLTRSGLDWTQKFGKAVVAALQDLAVGTAIIDGELVVETNSGASDFSALQADLSEDRSDRFVFYVFDLLYLDGYDLRALPLLDRKSLLEQLIAEDGGMIRYSNHFERERRQGAATCLSSWPRRDRLEASRRPISGRAQQELGQIEMLREAGICYWRLCALDGLEQSDRLAGAGYL